MKTSATLNRVVPAAEALAEIRNKVKISNDDVHRAHCGAMEQVLRIGATLEKREWKSLREHPEWKNRRMPTKRPAQEKRVRYLAFFVFGAHTLAEQKSFYDLIQAALIIYKEQETADGLAARLNKETVRANSFQVASYPAALK
jgi:hypothetical protein